MTPEDARGSPSLWDEGASRPRKGLPRPIPREEALARILSFTDIVEGIERIPILDALGRVLAEDVVSTIDLPPFDRAAMDGYAVRATDTRGASDDSPVSLAVVGEIAAGTTPDLRVEECTAVRIMTGAPAPPGADAVVMVERTRAHGDRVDIFLETREGKHVARTGENLRAGEVAVAKGSVVRPSEVGLLASIGVTRVLVRRRPRIAIISTGGEVQDPEVDAQLSPDKVWDANRYSIASQIIRAGGVPVFLPKAGDTMEELASRIAEGMGADAVVLSGGVSVGKFDLVTRLLEERGELIFWKVSVKPGKPVAFGRIGTTPVLGLPGNPLAAMIAFELFGRPMVLRLGGRARIQRPCVRATLAEGLKKEEKRTRIIAVSLTPRNAGYVAEVPGHQGSARLLAMVRSQGLAVIPPGPDPLEAGSEVDVLLMDFLDNLPKEVR